MLPHIILSHTRLLFFILLLAVLLRVGVALYLGDTTPTGKDETSYSLLAARLAGGHGYSFADGHYPFTPPNTPTAHWSFLYSALVAVVYAVAGPHPLIVRLLQAVITGLLMPWLAWRLAQRALPAPSPVTFTIHNSPFTIHNLTVLFAAFLVAIYAYFVLYGAMVQTEGLFLLAVLWSLERALAMQKRLVIRDWERRDWGVVATLGVSLAVATLLRQSILPWVAMLFGSLLLADLCTSRRLRWRTLWTLAVAGLIVAVGVLPFTLRNYRVYGDFLLLNSNAGYAMYSAQHPLHGVSFDAYAAAPLPTDLVPMPANEAQWDRALMARGIQFVLADPLRYLRLSASRAAIYFEFWPKASSSLLFNIGRLASFTLLLPLMAYGVWRVVKDTRRAAPNKGRVDFLFSPPSLLLLFALFYSLLHILTWAMPRYRLPVDAVMLIFAAAGLAELSKRVQAALSTVRSWR
jgi:hypothetical protein